MRTTLTTAARFALSLCVLASGDAFAKSSRDAKGKFMKCAPVANSNHCRDVKIEKFAKCGLPGTEDIP